jgi:hypothetical protein
MSVSSSSAFAAFLAEAAPVPVRAVELTGEGALASVFPVTDLAAASIAAVGLALARRVELAGHAAPAVAVDRRLASLWFAASVAPVGWTPPPVWDPIAGDYPTRDGFIRLHTNAPHHRAAALRALDVAGEREAVAAAVLRWSADELETAVVAENGCAAALHSMDAWARHPQGVAAAEEPLLGRQQAAPSRTPEPDIDMARPLKGLRVLDLTRALAGPVATRTLAGFGADVLRIDAPDWDEPAVLPDVTLGKRTARLDLRRPADRERFEALLAGADVFAHGLRSDALEALGLGEARRQAIRPGLVDVSLDAYGFHGPWAKRRGFDSLVQMSSGIAHAGMVSYGAAQPRPLPVQALDHAAGYLLAAAAIEGLNLRREAGRGSRWRTSLARVAAALVAAPAAMEAPPLAPPADADYQPELERTEWGVLRRLRPPLVVEGAPMAWSLPGTPLGRHEAAWLV